MENKAALHKKNQAENPTVIKKYANRRLYNTDTSTYITLEDLCAMIKRGEDFIVYDAKTGDDITRSVLTQVIVEQESKNYNLLPASFLRKVISFYDDGIREMLPQYLDASIDAFVKNQENMRSVFKGSLGGIIPNPQQFEEVAKQNMQLFQQAMTKMMDPFGLFAQQKKDTDTKE